MPLCQIMKECRQDLTSTSKGLRHVSKGMKCFEYLFILFSFIESECLIA